ncbi:MAG: hypothetical protein AAB697_00885 [Patescibacteria group bacterium]
MNLRRGSIFRNALLVGLTLFFLNGGAGIPLWGGLFIVSATVLVVTFLISPLSLVDRLKKTLGFSVLSVLFILMLNFYWIYPYIASYQYNYAHKIGVAGGNEGAIAWSQEISRNASFTNLFKLQGIPDWYDNPSHPNANVLLTNYFFLLLAVVFPIIAFVGLLNSKNQTYSGTAYKAVFLAVLLVAIPFTAGSHPPTGVLYNLALKYVPGFPIFRTPYYKFGMALWFAFAYLVAVGLKQLTVKRAPFFSLTVFIILLGIYNYPVFTGVFFNWSNKYSTRIKVPDYILEAKKELDSNSFSTRTLMLPQLHDGSKYIAYDWKYFSLSSIPSILSRSSVVLNDAVLSGNEPGLVNAIYQQLERFSQSSLLKYTVVDRAVVQDDFRIDESMDYLITPTKESIYREPNTSLSKEAGRWKFFNIRDPEMKPLIYIPQRFSYVLTETTRLAQVTQTPGFPLLSDAFVFKHISKGSVLDPIIDRERVQNITIQSECLNCEERGRVNVARSNPPPISPSNPFYFIIETIDGQKYKKYKLPTEKIDFTLGIMSKEVSAMDIIIANPKNKNTISYLLAKWSTNVNSIAGFFQSIDQQSQKEEYARRIYFYYWSLLTSARKWREFELTGLARSELGKFEDLLGRSVQELHLAPETPVSNYDVRDRLYSVSVPYAGTYKLAVYNFKPDDQRTLLGSVNDVPHSFTRSALDNHWYFSDSVNLNEGGQLAVLPELIRRKKFYPGFKINAPARSAKCEEVNLGQVNNEIDYSLNLEYLTLSDRFIKIDLLEVNKHFPKGNEKTIYPKINAADPFSYKVDFNYKPSIHAETALLRICVEGAYDFVTVADLKGVRVVEKYPDYLLFLTQENPPVTPPGYHLQFVALNQTAYLVKVSGVEDQFILGFNSRFDQQWGVREVDINLAEPYFKGQEKSYLEGKVIEYERQDKHVLSDFAFKKGVSKSPDIELNAYGNGWLINSDGKNEMAFLIEYRPQNTLYKTFLVSVVALFGLGLIWLVLRRDEYER